MEMHVRALDGVSRLGLRALLTLVSASLVVSCGNNDSAFDFMSQPTGDGSNKPCVISKFTPTVEGKLRVPSTALERRLFTVVSSNSSCEVKWTLNGEDITDADTPGVLNLQMGLLRAGDNTLEAKATNPAGAATQTWTLSKNNPPVCAQQLPSTTGNAMAVGTTLNMNLTSTDADNDPMTFTWNVGGVSVDAAILTTTTSATTTAGSFTPDTDMMGPRTINAQINDGLDTTTCSWSVSVRAGCSIASSLPSDDSKRVAAAVGTLTSFGVVPSDASCNVAWTLNGTPLPLMTSFVNITSADLNSGSNTLVATVGNSVSNVSRTWTVLKNQPPTCATRNPAEGVSSKLNLPGTLNFTVGAADPESDSVTFEWRINGLVPPTGIFTTTTMGTNSSTVFAPTSAYSGQGIVTVALNDGFDSTQCQFPTEVVNTCSFMSTSPSGASTKIAFAGATTNAFAVTPSNDSCVVNWTLNGAAVGSPGNTLNLTSAQFLQGNNILEAAMGVGESVVKKSWTVLRNTPPTCDSQIPAAAGSVIGITGNIMLTANAVDVNSDPVNFSWKVNGAVPTAQYLSFTSASMSSTASFSPANSYVGNNTIIATIDDGFDSNECSWSVNVLNACSVVSSSPSTTTQRVANNGSSVNTFSVTPNDASCEVTWKFNGTDFGSKNSVVTLMSSAVGAGLNTLEATIANAGSSVTRTWTISKNNPAVCSNQTPPVTGSAVAIPASLALTVQATDAESDPLSYTWKLNGMIPPDPVFNVLSAGSTSLNTFTPDVVNIGNATVSVNMDDGYDVSSCEWAVKVLPSCTLTGPVPASASPRVSNVPTTSTTFSITPNDVSCELSWSLNGSPIGGTAASLNVLSSSLNSGSNNLVVTATNGSSTATYTWNVTRNVPPTCGSQMPAATGTIMGISDSINLTANGFSSASLPLTFTWDLNGIPSSTTNFAFSGVAPQSIATFSPAGANAGENVITATMNDGYDTAKCSWNLTVQNNCQVTSSSPAVSTVRVANEGTTSTNFAVVPSDPTCSVAWTLNGQPFGSASSFQDILSSTLNSGTNALVATLSNGTSTATKTWTVNKNTPPICSSQTPLATGNIVALPNSLNLVANGSDSESDALTFAWTLNGLVPTGSVFTTLSSSSTSQTAFTPEVTHVGSNSIAAEINDGYDKVKCEWAVTVLPACSIVNTSPTANSHRIKAAADTANVFSVTPSDAGCAVTWTLNGSQMSGAAATTKSLNSSVFNTGDNTLVATASNGSSSATKTWVVNKNTPPVCASLNPAATGAVVGVNGGINLTVVGTDTNSDALTFDWNLNGIPATPTNFVTTSTASQSTTTFSPAGGYIGSNTISTIMSDGFDTTTCSWTLKVQNDCSVTSSSPSTTTVKVSNVGTVSTDFSAIPNDATCATTWKLNGSDFGVAGNSVSVLSSALTAGANTLLATITNGTSTTTRTWNVYKNTPPTCASQNPPAAGARVALSASLSLNAGGGDIDNDSLTFAWTIGGEVPAGSVFSVVSGTSTSLNTFTPIAAYLGNQVVVSEISDGYDKALCQWDIQVLPACSLSGEIPVAASPRVSNVPTTSTTFSIVPNHESCILSWSLNGSSLNSSLSSVSLLSSALNSGNNNLTVTATNGSSTATHAWTVIRNQPPTCDSQSPSATGVTIGASSNINLTANGKSTANLPLSFSWTLNGQPALPANFSFSGTDPQSIATFSPAGANIGENVIVAKMDDGFDTATCNWTLNVANNCAVTSSNPSVSTVKVAAAGSTSTNFAIVPNDPSCEVTWTLNSQTLGSAANFKDVLSSALTAGSNTLVATLSNGTSTATRSWTVVKNTAPLCASQTPNALGNVVAIPASFSLTANGSDADTDPLTFAWSLNGTVPGAGVFATLSGSSSSQTSFTPTTSHIGNNSVLATISDGLDSNSCEWTVKVLPTCTISGFTPTTPHRIAAAADASNSFSVTPSDASCDVTWTLNGSPISGASANTKALNSSLFNTGANTLVATVSNGSSSATQTWSVDKNIPPVCSSITPAATGAIVGVNGSINLTANGTDVNGDNLSFAWKLNGNNSSATNFSTNSTALQSVSAFSPAGGLVGTNNITSVISDGFDTTTCSWEILVQNDCSVTSSIPSTATAKVAALASTSTNFTVVPNDASCSTTWKLTVRLLAQRPTLCPSFHLN